ncbi:MAG TPA: alpha/beta fold hydrolase [Actinomycetota bacterium]|nr:alpha/beta fold hydrolase [Actinomycetota bacterium]
MTVLLLVHAFPVDASMWEPQITGLGGDLQVLAPSLPGFGGESPPPGAVLTMDAAADAMGEALDRAGVQSAVICGLSMGGYVAFSMWRRHRDRIDALVLADTRAEPDDDAGRERRRTVAETARTRGSAAIAENPPALLSDGADDALWDRVKGWIRAQPGEAIAAASLGMAERPDSRPILGEIDVPTTIVVGSADALTPPAMSESMAEAIPGAQLVVLDGAGHLSNLEDPEGFNAAIEGILDRVGREGMQRP